MPASQSSVSEQGKFDYSASNAVDGGRSTRRQDNSCTQSNAETNPWWTVDLGLPLTVTGILFTNAAQAGETCAHFRYHTVMTLLFRNIGHVPFCKIVFENMGLHANCMQPNDKAQ